MNTSYRPLTIHDQAFLGQFLTHALYLPEGQAPFRHEIVWATETRIGI